MAEKTFLCQEAQHNKFWSHDTNGNNVIVKWGRVGGSSQSKEHTFSSPSSRDAFIADKVAEKIKKGYREIDQQKKQEETETAQDLGTQFKINRIEWVDRKGKDLNIISNYDPSRFVYVEILNSWSKEVVRLLLNKTETYKIDGIAQSDRTISCGQIFASADRFAGAVRRYLQRIAQKVQVAVVKFGASIRVLDLGDDEGTTTAIADMAAMAPDWSSLVGEAGASSQVVNRMAGLGCRVLDI
jgi:predicted DNA-binding WGR domain protein